MISRERERVDASIVPKGKGEKALARDRRRKKYRSYEEEGERRREGFFFLSFARDDAKDETGNGEKDRDGRGRFGTTSRKGGFFSLLLLLFFARRIRETASKNIREAKLESN